MRLHDGHYLTITKRKSTEWMGFSTLYNILIFRGSEQAVKRDLITAVLEKVKVVKRKLEAYEHILEDEAAMASLGNHNEGVLE